MRKIFQYRSTTPLWIAVVPILVLILLLVFNVLIYGDGASSGPNQIALLLSASVAAVLGILLGQVFLDMLSGIISSLESSMSAMLLLLLIGSLTGTWMISGVVPAMIYYGLDLLDAKIFLAACVVICAIVSVATGSSWSTIATVGVALLGIGAALGVSQPMAAGAIISGAYFGDKISPLSDTTNLASAMAGAELFDHIRYMLWTTVPSILITVAIFAIVGFWGEPPTSDVSTDELQSAIAAKFNIHLWLFLVPAAVLALVVWKVNAIAALFTGVVLGGVFAVIFQPAVILEVSGLPTTTTVNEAGQTMAPAGYAVHSYAAVVNAMATSTSVDSGNERAADLLKGKGMEGMLNTIWLIVTAMCFGGVMEATGFLRRITQPLVKVARSDGSLIATTAGTCMFFNATASDQYLAIVVPGRMFRETYRERRLQPKVLSRTLEDSGTVTSVLVPWNTCGAAQQGVLGVDVTAFAPWCLFNIISPIMTMIYGFLGIKIAHIDKLESPMDGNESQVSE